MVGVSIAAAWEQPDGCVSATRDIDVQLIIKLLHVDGRQSLCTTEAPRVPKLGMMWLSTECNQFWLQSASRLGLVLLLFMGYKTQILKIANLNMTLRSLFVLADIPGARPHFFTVLWGFQDIINAYNYKIWSHQENSKMLIFYLICLINLLKLKLSKISERKEQDWTYSS